MMVLLTQDSTFIIKYVAFILGKIMEIIFNVLDAIGIPNIGLAIIIFTILVNLLMLPLTIKQQKFSKLSAIMQPEMQAIQKKYKDKKDQDSQMAMSQEMQEVYAKYGVSPTGSCGYLLIQFPILISLYRVIYAMPAYVGKINATFTVLAEKIIKQDGGDYVINSTTKTIASNVAMFSKNFDKNNVNGIIDILNRLSTSDINYLSEHYHLADLTYQGQRILSSGSERGLIDTYNNFFGLNIGNSPQFIIINAFQSKAWLLMVAALMIPVLSAVTQWINVKLMPQQPSSGNEQADSMASSMKAMNTFMPLMSAAFGLTLPAGMGLYWIAGSVVRSIQQVVINKHIDKMDFDEIISKNREKSAKKIEKMKQNQERMNAYAAMSTRNINTMQNKANVSSSLSEKEKEEAYKKATSIK